jgi:hypothetical protein
MARLHKRYRHRRKSREGSAPRRNPPLITELGEWIGPGFAAFAATRFGTRIAATQIAKKKPSWAKHAGAIASVAAFAAAWLLAHRVKFLAKYHTPIAVGAGIAALQSLIQLYVPKLGWMVADATPEIAHTPAPAQPQLPANFELLDDDPSIYTYNDAYDAGRYAGSTSPTGMTSGVAPAVPDDDLDIDLEGEDQMMSVGAY